MSEDVQADRDRALAALWEIRMAVERWTTDQSPVVFANLLIALALAGMGENKHEAQTLAAERRQFGSDVERGEIA